MTAQTVPSEPPVVYVLDDDAEVRGVCRASCVRLAMRFRRSRR